MTHSLSSSTDCPLLSSSTESEALRIGDPVGSGFPFSREWQRGDAGM